METTGRPRVPLHEHLRLHARTHPNKAACIWYGRPLTYGELDRASDAFAARLHRLGICKGEPVALFLGNCPQYMIAHYGIQKLGAVVCPCGALFKEHELAYQLAGEYLRQAGFLLDEGCSPQQVDRAVERFGMAMGPFRMSDMAGNDIGWAIRKRHAVERPRLRYSASADRLCEMGRLGQKSGAGWYDYAPGQRTPQPSPAVEDMLVAHRARLGITPRRVSEVEIVQRLIYALVNEGARILEEGIAARAGDIDVVYLHGYGFPAWRGGPMYYAQQVGLADVVAAMQRFARNPLDDAGFWQPAALLQHLALSGQGFSR